MDIIIHDLILIVVELFDVDYYCDLEIWVRGHVWSDTAGDKETAEQNLIEFYALVNLKPQ